jgi:hypothetical protein
MNLATCARSLAGRALNCSMISVALTLKNLYPQESSQQPCSLRRAFGFSEFLISTLSNLGSARVPRVNAPSERGIAARAPQVRAGLALHARRVRSPDQPGAYWCLFVLISG